MGNKVVIGDQWGIELTVEQDRLQELITVVAFDHEKHLSEIDIRLWLIGETDKKPDIFKKFSKENKKKEPFTEEKEMETKKNANLELFDGLAATISELAKQGVDECREEIVERSMVDVIEHTKEYIEEEYGLLPTKLQIKVGRENPVEIVGTMHKTFEDILLLVSNKIPVMLVGPAGSGKNHTVEQIAKALNFEMYFSNAVTQEYKITGFIDANGVYQETQFYKAFKDGGVFFFDEMDASCADALLVVNAAIANGYFDFPNGKITAHENFRVIAAANTYGNGASMAYVGRSQLDGATLDRFSVIPFDYDKAVEKALTKDDALFEFIQELRRAIDKSGIRFIVSMRASIHSSKLVTMRLSKKKILAYTICKSMDTDDINTIVDIIKSTENNREWINALKSYALEIA